MDEIMVKIISAPSAEAMAKVTEWNARKAGKEAKKLAERLAKRAATRVNPAPVTARGKRRTERRQAAR